MLLSREDVFERLKETMGYRFERFQSRSALNNLFNSGTLNLSILFFCGIAPQPPSTNYAGLLYEYAIDMAALQSAEDKLNKVKLRLV